MTRRKAELDAVLRSSEEAREYKAIEKEKSVANATDFLFSIIIISWRTEERDEPF